MLGLYVGVVVVCNVRLCVRCVRCVVGVTVASDRVSCNVVHITSHGTIN